MSSVVVVMITVLSESEGLFCSLSMKTPHNGSILENWPKLHTRWACVKFSLNFLSLIDACPAGIIAGHLITAEESNEAFLGACPKAQRDSGSSKHKASD